MKKGLFNFILFFSLDDLLYRCNNTLHIKYMYETISIMAVHYTHCIQSGVYVNILDEGGPIPFIRFLRCSVTLKRLRTPGIAS